MRCKIRCLCRNLFNIFSRSFHTFFALVFFPTFANTNIYYIRRSTPGCSSRLGCLLPSHNHCTAEQQHPEFVTSQSQCGIQPQRVNPHLHVRRVRIRVLPARQPYRILRQKPSHVRIVIAQQVVVQTRLFVVMLVLQPERLADAADVFLPLQPPQGVVFAVPQQPALRIGQLPRPPDLVAVEIVDALVAPVPGIGPVAYLRQRFVAVLSGVQVGMRLPAVDCL